MELLKFVCEVCHIEKLWIEFYASNNKRRFRYECKACFDKTKRKDESRTLKNLDPSPMYLNFRHKKS